MRKFLFMILLLLLSSCTQLKLARDAYKQNDFEKAIQVCNKMLAVDSTNTNALDIVSDAYKHLGKLDSAIFAAEKLSNLNPTHEKFQEKLYNLYLSKGDQLLPDDPKNSLVYFERAQKLTPEKPQAFEKKADALIIRKKFELARVELKSALERNADSVRVQQKLANIDSVNVLAEKAYQRGMEQLSQNRYEEAKKEFAQALEVMPYKKEAKFQFHMSTGKRLYKKGSVNSLWDAIDNFASASLLYPDRSEPHYFLGLAYNKKDKDEYINALDELQRAVDLEPDSKWAKAAQKESEKIKARKKKMDNFWGAKKK